MTIAIISMIRDPWGGSEELWYDMAKAALRDGHKVIHLRYETLTVHPKMEELISLGLIAYKRPGWIPSTAGNLKRFVYIGWNYFRKRVKDPLLPVFEHKPDVVLYNGTCYSISNESSLLKILRAKKGLRFFIIGHLNHDFIRTINDSDVEIIKRSYQLAQKVFFVSQRNLQTAQRHLATVISNSAIVRNPVNMTITSSIVFPSIKRSINFALVGNLVTQHKGQDILFSVLGTSVWLDRNWQLNIYGSGPDENYLKLLASSLGIADRVLFHGTVGNVRLIWEHNHALIMPSIMEGMPLAIVEAMICARPCIATDIGGSSEWIEDNVSGFIAEAPTVGSLSKTMQVAWEQRESWEEIGLRARRKALSLYDENAGISLLKKLMND